MLQGYVPITVMTHPTMYEVVAIHIIHMIKVRGYQDFNVFLLQSGIVMRSTKFIGQVINHQIRSHVEFGQFFIFTISTKIIYVYIHIGRYLLGLRLLKGFLYIFSCNLCYLRDSSSPLDSNKIISVLLTRSDRTNGWRVFLNETQRRIIQRIELNKKLIDINNTIRK